MFGEICICGLCKKLLGVDPHFYFQLGGITVCRECYKQLIFMATELELEPIEGQPN